MNSASIALLLAFAAMLALGEAYTIALPVAPVVHSATIFAVGEGK